MREIQGKYNTAKIFTDIVDDKAIDQVKLLLDQGFISGSKIRMMPDIHAGAGCTIGTTMTITDKICPNLVGVDIGCGVLVVRINKTENQVDLNKLDRCIRACIPSGYNVRNDDHYNTNRIRVNELDCYLSVNSDPAYRRLGTLGGGNHFIEVDKDDAGYLYLVIHTGSRHLGVEVAEYYQMLAYDTLRGTWKTRREFAIDCLKRDGMENKIQEELEKIGKFSIPKDLGYVSGKLFNSYLHDMEITQEYAKWNRITIADEILAGMGWKSMGEFETVHNYIDTRRMILRKGAVSAQAGEELMIPINMRDGSLICVGKGDPDWNYSAPHGAGRLFGRMEANRRFGMEEFKESMKGVYTTSVNEDTLDECPMAYKSMDDIVNNITDTVDILKVIKPIYNFKAGKEE